MANPRQRRKARSSSYKPVSHSLRAKKMLKKAPPIQGPKVLQDAWDKHKTVRQNYTMLGLVHRLDPIASGGVEERSTGRADTGVGMSKYGRIGRDEEGNVVGIWTEGEEEGTEEAGVDRRWVEIGGSEEGILSTLSPISSSAGPRHSSTLELNYLERLLEKYGLDLDKMARDTKMNFEQRTVGELRRGFKRVGLTGRDQI